MKRLPQRVLLLEMYLVIYFIIRLVQDFSGVLVSILLGQGEQVTF